jgi:SAM-dependent methyltransferase
LKNTPNMTWILGCPWGQESAQKALRYNANLGCGTRVVHFMNEPAFKLRPLPETDLGLDGDAIFDALSPYVADADPRQFRAEVKLRQKRIRKRLIRRFRNGWSRYRRSAEEVFAEYDDAWRTGHSRYDLSKDRKCSPWLWRGKKMLVDAAGAARMRSVMIGAVIRKLKPKRVLEVGCGDGINLFLLAGAFPEISFTGIELTNTGHQVSLDLQAKPVLPEHLLSYAPLDQKDRQAFKRIRFDQGNACAMPYETGGFDLVLTVLSVEQMEEVRSAALAEIARVTGSHLLSLEPFRDVNKGMWRRLNVASRDYFRGSVLELQQYGIQPLWATADFPQEVTLGSALVLGHKAE